MAEYEKVKKFDIEFLSKAFEEGWLFIKRPQIKDSHMYKREVLDYVGRIKDCASDEWKDKVDVLWQKIVDEPRFQEKLKMQKGEKVGHLNRYMVTALVSLMREWKVYREEETMLSLHKKMENITEKNSVYKGYVNYGLDTGERKAIKELIKAI